jgi:hypothetical protein
MESTASWTVRIHEIDERAPKIVVQGTRGAEERVVHGGRLPRISEFFGIVITMYYNDHAPPHFHARYGEHEAQFAIESLTLLRGSLPSATVGLVREWAVIHREELFGNWEAARHGEPLSKIAGLA